MVPTSSQETNVNVQGPLMPELQAILPEAVAARIKRQGVVNAWDDEDFANACRKAGRRNLVMAGVTTDVCMVSPAGFHIAVAHNAIVAELVRNWASPAGAVAFPLLT